MQFIDNLKKRYSFGGKQTTSNKYNDSFFKLLGGAFTAYDTNGDTYIDKGYNINPTVFAVISQQSKKTSSVPSYIKKIDDKRARKKLLQLKSATNYGGTPQQQIKQLILESKAYDDKADKDFPMDRPNPLQTWNEIEELYKTMMKTNGNCYIYMVTKSQEDNMGEPIGFYILPSQYTQIVLKDGVAVTPSNNPISHYVLTQGNQYIEFEQENVIHIKYPNPNFGTNGEHLYGQSPLRAALRNIQSSNEALNLNIKTLKSGGAFGFIHGKQTPLTSEQAKELKSRLVEMDSDPANLAKIAGSSAEIGFTRISLTTDEMKPFEYLKFDEKQICNVLGWKDKLLNNDEGSNFGAYITELRKQVITDDIMPDLNLLSAALNDRFLPRFKGYENCELVYDPSELPEMQTDMVELTKWLNDALDRGVITRDEYRFAINYTRIDTEEMKTFTVANPVISLKDSLDDNFTLNGE